MEARKMKKLFTLLTIFAFVQVSFGQVGDVIITEIMYNPNSSETNTKTQFIEIGNTTANSIDLGNWTIDDEDADGPNTIPTGTTIPAYGIVVLCGGSEADFRTAWGTAIDANALIVSFLDDGQTMFNLSNSPSATSEIIQLKNASTTLIDEVNFDDSSPWPSDNNASSIYLNLTPSTMTSVNNDDGANWSISVAGTDGAIQDGASGVWNGNDFGSPGNVQGQSALPVELTSFTANVVDNSVVLSWQTATEVNNYGFEVARLRPEKERDYAEASWETLGFVNGHGNSNSPKSYSFTDNSAISGKYSYRLKQIDVDGKFEYSDVAEVTIGAPDKFELLQNYPNPFNPSTTIKYSIPDVVNENFRSVKISVYDILGREIAVLVNKSQKPGFYKVNFDASDLTSGLYFYRISAGTFVDVKKMMLLK